MKPAMIKEHGYIAAPLFTDYGSRIAECNYTADKAVNECVYKRIREVNPAIPDYTTWRVYRTNITYKVIGFIGNLRFALDEYAAKNNGVIKAGDIYRCAAAWCDFKVSVIRIGRYLGDVTVRGDCRKDIRLDAKYIEA
jgi:hypothetical protein